MPPGPADSRRRRVIFVASGLATGGAEMMLYKLLRTLPQQEFSATVVSLRDRSSVGNRIVELGIPVHALNLQRPWRVVGGLARLVRICHEVDPDVLVGWMYHGNLLATLAGAGPARRAALVWSVRQTLYDLGVEPPLTSLVIRAGARLSARPVAIIYNSEVAAQQHRDHGYRPRREVIIPNGFDCDMFRPNPEARGALRERLGVPPAAPVVGLVARYHPMKDHATFLEAARLLAAGREVHFVCAGTGVDEANRPLAALVARLGLTGRVHLLGEVADVSGLLAGLDILCSSSSRGEGFSNVLGEAMACGIPCATTDVGASGVVVGETGRVVPTGDPSALALACAALLDESPEARARRSRAARERVLNHFSLQAVAVRYARLLEEAAGSFRPRDEGGRNGDERAP